jgi:hypothetical protein
LLCKRYSLKDDALWHIRTERPLQHWSLPQKTSRQFQTNFGLLGPARLGRAVIMLLLQLELSFFITRCRGPTPSLLMLTVEGKERPDFDQFAVPVWKKMRVESQQHHRAEANQVILLRLRPLLNQVAPFTSPQSATLVT